MSSGEEEIPLIQMEEKESKPPKSVEGFSDWRDVWYRLDEGRGKVSLENLQNRIRPSTNNHQAIPKAVQVLRAADKTGKGYVEYAEFRDYYENELHQGSWERGVLARVALDIQDLTPQPDEEAIFRAWENLVNYVKASPNSLDFKWSWILPREYARDCLLYYVSYRSELVHPSRLSEWLMNAQAVDDLPNRAVIDLLEKCQTTIRRADTNRDGYIEYNEFLRFVRVKHAKFRGATVLRRGALAVLPRNAKSLENRRYIEEYSCWPPPLFMLLITLSEIITFIIYAVDMQLPTTGSGPCPTYSPLVFNPRRRYQAWRFLTYALIHSGWVHLVNNILVQLLLGVLLEMVHSWRIILIYLAGVAAGALANSLYMPSYYLAGASGGVYAVEYAHLSNLILNWSSMEYPLMQLLLILVVMSADLGYAIWDTYSSDVTATGHMAHFGGAVAGVLVGVLVLRNLEVERWEKYCRWISLGLFGALMVCGVLLQILLPMPDYFPDNDWSPMAEDREEWNHQQMWGLPRPG
ncbi:rhomboid-related protein 1-like isoform X2 [Portunus trituberculatus]|uniref:rhomboid-related protein 1-like isoform X2 n=1 Tax=Portunus trituberculatus TaxID=210409 RepID=UPI001E1CD9AC|nr:rhomboid-related protein 1-like isoform X2 [Portunus trituberculatus]XP_045109585.1 rhomboid-related protein 1-like isoform X2 [Portunus trituberculatus]XP_045109587.1 rhomboid-related protein 1-like isoform X2 [Portunus trituberculatus]XP_045109588.1 rhomboid-related protein 1-like isoform X2 [Portunus trituberculatus]XP_045109589.1 rhomboid-related protein 1-like isoform X2 [Portunus trituberculatus]XP_045109590.1 rhomboid-related protein 1-like isoform X2 [Portunus trituberculatus]XP_04